jgi:probable HAF family extracellular repeat protein
MFAFLYSNGSMQDLGTLPSGTDSFPDAISDSGQVVGYASLSNGSQHAFLYSNGQMVDLNSLIDPTSGWVLNGATSINAAGQIAGYGLNANGQNDAFLLTPVTAPRVTGLQVDGSSWSNGFLSTLKSAGDGNGTGYAIPVGSPAQLTDLPWSNLNQIQISFSENVSVQENSLAVTGIHVAQYTFSNFSYNSATHVATWTLANSIGPDKLSLDLKSTGPDAVTDTFGNGYVLDGEWADGAAVYPSGNGAPGGDFVFDLNVLPGDLDQNGTVNGADLAQIASHWLQTGGLAGDANGDNFVNAQDIVAVASHWLATLPAGGGAANGNSSSAGSIAGGPTASGAAQSLVAGSLAVLSAADQGLPGGTYISLAGNPLSSPAGPFASIVSSFDSSKPAVQIAADKTRLDSAKGATFKPAARSATLPAPGSETAIHDASTWTLDESLLETLAAARRLRA